MAQDFFYPSRGGGQIHMCRWDPKGEPKAVVQIVHGIAEHIARYDDFARYLNSLGYIVVAEDHMGHGRSVGEEGTLGYFDGGWFAAVEDTYQLLKDTRNKFPHLPYFLLGHSMGSFMSRTILEKFPNSGIAGCILSGTGWLPESLLKVGIPTAKLVCTLCGEKKPNTALQNVVFAGYNKHVKEKRTAFDWLTRENSVVDAYIADPFCGFVASAGLLRDLQLGIRFNQEENNLLGMNKSLPVLLVSGEEDPVGNYGAGVRKTAEKFRNCGMENVTCKLYPDCRHEILNESNKQEIYGDIAAWISQVLARR